MIAAKGFPSRLRKPCSGPICAALDELFDLRGLELAARQDAPEREVAVLALELLVVLLHDAAAFGARRVERRVLARHGVALMRLRTSDDVLGHVGDAFA